MSPIIVISSQIIKTGFFTQSSISSLSPVSPSSCQRLDIADLPGLLAAAQSARAGLLPGQTLPGQLKSAEMLGDTALHSSGGLHTLELPGNK